MIFSLVCLLRYGLDRRERVWLWHGVGYGVACAFEKLWLALCALYSISRSHC